MNHIERKTDERLGDMWKGEEKRKKKEKQRTNKRQKK